jgi:DNA-binding NarL/FixJ family response regulator
LSVMVKFCYYNIRAPTKINVSTARQRFPLLVAKKFFSKEKPPIVKRY